jgi:hypothetical protein
MMYPYDVSLERVFPDSRLRQLFTDIVALGTPHIAARELVERHGIAALETQNPTQFLIARFERAEGVTES